MKLTRTERWILSNQCKILETLNPENIEHYQTTKEIIDNGYEILYEDQIQYILPEGQTLSEEEGRFVLDVLCMFRQITYAIQQTDDKTGINTNYLKYMGFDGNNEGKYCAFAAFFCEKLGRFQEIGTGDDQHNSHSPTLDTYSRMLEAWNQSKDKYHLNKDDLLKISLAFVHPERR